MNDQVPLSSFVFVTSYSSFTKFDCKRFKDEFYQVTLRYEGLMDQNLTAAITGEDAYN